jgi:hypothetical protein
MERESFENEAIAEVMNRNFVCIKVDREERPDLDEIYMQATVTLNRGQGGWPMTVFLTPEQQPFFAGTYFPPEDRWGRPGFLNLLKKIAEAWERDPAGLRGQAADLTERLLGAWQVSLPMSVSRSALDEAVRQLHEEFDPRYGGFGSAPKFPPTATLSLLLRCYRRSGDATALRMVTRTLDAMAAGGIYDHIGGGFARYSTDDRWLVPHFEKMLYDNALLARVYLEAYQVTGHVPYRQIVTEVIEYILHEMTGPDGGFYSATDADSEGVEGKFFVWTPAEVRDALQNEEDAHRFCACYDITDQGNWEHRSIPNRLRPLEAVAKDLNLTTDELQETIRRVRPLLYEARRLRVPPGLDDKVVTAWNGMMLSAMAESGRVLGVSRYIEAAQRAANFLLRVHRTPEGKLFRTSRHGRAHLEGVLEDYAHLGEGLIDLYEACGQASYLDAAHDFGERLMDAFRDPHHGGFFTTAGDHEVLIARPREGADGATPSGNAVAASLLARLSYHYDRSDLREAAIAAIRAYGKQIARFPRGFAKSLTVADFLLEGPVELAFVGAEGDPALQALEHAARAMFLPNRIIARSTGANGAARHPLLAGKSLVDGKPALYICRNFTCRRPLTDPSEVADALCAMDNNPVNEPPQKSVLKGLTASGAATVEGTARYAARHPHGSSTVSGLGDGYTLFGATGLAVSRLGFGGYRIDGSDPEFRAALAKALLHGVNLIDTSTNYMDGESERLIGSVLRELIAKGEVARDEVVVISKIGYVQGENLKSAEEREKSGRPYPEMVKYGEGIWHCVHPEFLHNQLTASLDRLGLDTLDVCLLHNPEYFLSEAAHRGNSDLEAQRALFYQRMEQAFAYLESQVEAGRIRWYGVSSNTVTAKPSDPEATSFTDFLAAASRAAASRGRARACFAVLQLPMNLFESGALTTPNTGHGRKETVLDVAQRERVAVLVNRPLNAMPARGTGVIRLSEMAIEEEPVNLENQTVAVEALEEEYRKTLAPVIPFSGRGTPPADFFNWGTELSRVRHRLQGLEQWEPIEHQMIAPHLNQVLQAVPQLVSGPVAEQWETWRDRYIPQLLTLLRGFRREAAQKSRTRAERIAAAVDPLLPEAKRKEPLSRKALWTLVSTPGVTCVLNGMRSRAYVEDAIDVLAWSHLKDVHGIYQSIAESGIS